MGFRTNRSGDFNPNEKPPLLYPTQATENCSAEVFFAKGEEQNPAQVEVSCEELIRNNTLDQEEALFQQYKSNQSLQSAHNLPGRCASGPYVPFLLKPHSTSARQRWISPPITRRQIDTATWSLTRSLCGTWALWPPASSC